MSKAKVAFPHPLLRIGRTCCPNPETGVMTMTNQVDVTELCESIRRMGGVVVQDGDSITVTGVRGIGPFPMPTLVAAERMRKAVQSQVSAAVLGFRGAVRCCRAAGLDEDRVFQLVRDNTN